MQIPNYYARTETNQRDNNEDCHTVFFLLDDRAEQIPVLVVADGMGGHEHGEDVSRQVVLKVEDFLKKRILDLNTQPDPTEYLKQCLLDALQSANVLVQRMVSANGWERAGSTIVMGLIWQNKLIAANLGDSPLFHWSAQSGALDRVTQDHSVPGILVQANLISEEMARYHERRGQLEFFVGNNTLPQPSPIYERTLVPGDLLMLCSDGVSGTLHRDQIQSILADRSPDLPEKAAQLIQAAREEGETDNQTIILWRYMGASQQPSTTLRTLALGSTLKSHPRSEQRSTQHSTATTHAPADTSEPKLLAELPSRSRFRRRGLSRKAWVLIGAMTIAGAVAAVVIVKQLIPQMISLISHRQPPPRENPPAQPPLQIEWRSPETPILTTKDPETLQPLEWHQPILLTQIPGCGSNLPTPGEKQVMTDQKPEQILTKSEGTECIRVWRRASLNNGRPANKLLLRRVSIPWLDRPSVILIPGERS